VLTSLCRPHPCPQVYEHLGLNAEQASPYVEHNGSLDMLRAVVMYLRRQQQGWGVVAVSPRCVAVLPAHALLLLLLLLC